MIAYFEEEAVRSYTSYLKLVESGEVPNVPAPKLAIKYYKMEDNAKLSDLIKKVRADELHHSKINHKYADGDTPKRKKWLTLVKNDIINNYEIHMEEGNLYKMKMRKLSTWD